jgi:hypothetical protein
MGALSGTKLLKHIIIILLQLVFSIFEANDCCPMNAAFPSGLKKSVISLTMNFVGISWKCTQKGRNAFEFELKHIQSNRNQLAI